MCFLCSQDFFPGNFSVMLYALLPAPICWTTRKYQRRNMLSMYCKVLVVIEYVSLVSVCNTRWLLFGFCPVEGMFMCTLKLYFSICFPILCKLRGVLKQEGSNELTVNERKKSHYDIIYHRRSLIDHVNRSR